MIDKRLIGHTFAPFSSVIEAGLVRLFCKAVGEAAAIHRDAQAARDAGYRNILAPLTFPTAISMDNPNPHCVSDLIDVDIGWILHGEEHYEYSGPICVSDEITTESRIADIYDKKGGALEFVSIELDMRNQLDERVCRIRRVLVVRRPQSRPGSA